MIAQRLFERIEHLEGWDDMDEKERFVALQQADMFRTFTISTFSESDIDELASRDMQGDRGEVSEEDIWDYTEACFITDPNDQSCPWYRKSDIEQLSSETIMDDLRHNFPELGPPQANFDDWLFQEIAGLRRNSLLKVAASGKADTPDKI